jgi:hypothetical protein
VLEVLLFVPLVVANPKRMTRESRNLRRLAIGLVLLIATANTVALVLLVRQLVIGRVSEGTTLLLAAGQVWTTNILVFSLAYWELDRGGSVQRTQTPRPRLPAADFRFPQDEDHDTIAEVRQRSSEKSGWVPGFLDYLYVSITNLLRVQPHRHHAAITAGQDAHGNPVRVLPSSLCPGYLPRYQPAEMTCPAKLGVGPTRPFPHLLGSPGADSRMIAGSAGARRSH